MSTNQSIKNPKGSTLGAVKIKRRIFSGMLILLGSLFWLAAVSSDDARVYVINIRNEIGNGLRVYINNGIKRASDAEADAIIFDVHTPGGAVGAARDIIDAIQRTEIPTIAYVNTEAISAGAMISLSCDQIVMRGGGAIGDSAPVSIQGEELSEKAVSYIRGKIRATAERGGRNPDIAAAMVDKRLYLVRLMQTVKLLRSGKKNILNRRMLGWRWRLSPPEAPTVNCLL